MRLARKLFLLAAMALTALALGASTASAENPVTVVDEDGGADCGTVTLGVPPGGPHTVAGGCHISYQSEGVVPLTADFGGGPVTVFNCRWHIEGYIGTNGSGYVTQAALTTAVPPTNPACTRAPCDEDAGANDTMLPWPLSIQEGEDTDPPESAESVEVTFCLRNAGSANEGAAGSNCRVHLPVTEDEVNHNHEIGTPTGEYACEVQPIPGVTLRIHNVHFLVEGEEPEDQEDIEILH